MAPLRGAPFQAFKSYGVMEASIQVSEEDLGGQTLFLRRQAERVKPVVQWRPQEGGEARNMEHC